MKKINIDGLERIGGVFVIILIVGIIISSMLYGYVNNGNPMEKIEEETANNVEVIDNNYKKLSSDSIPCDTETPPCSEEDDSIPCDTEEINNSIVYAESILSNIEGCTFTCSQQSENSIMYTISIDNTVEFSKLKISLSNACYLIKYNTNLDNNIEHVIIFVVKNNNTQLVKLICKDCAITLDNL